MKAAANIALVFLMVAVLIGSFRDLIIEGVWVANQAQIIAEKCENKARPQMRCDGKCYLKKQLQAEETNKPAPNFDNKVPFQWIVQTAEPLQYFQLSVPLVYSDYLITSFTGDTDPLEHPPRTTA